jgi:branched-chain amino acid aminotransferase
MLSYTGYIADGSGENVFIVKDGVLQTPHLASGCLGGITRESVMMLARDLDIAVTEENLVRTDVYNADEAFFTGTAAEVTPIREIDDRQVGEGHRGPVTKQLQDAFFAAAHAKDERYRHWLTPVS